jgi:hypothetical protein
VPEEKAYTIIKEVKLQHTLVKLRSDGIIQFEYGDHVHYGMAETQELEDVVKEITNDVAHRSLRITGKYSSTDIEIMRYLAKGRGALFTLADAFILHSSTQRVLANFYMKIQRPYVPTAFFDTVEEAEAWLKSLDQRELEEMNRKNKLRIK